MFYLHKKNISCEQKFYIPFSILDNFNVSEPPQLFHIHKLKIEFNECFLTRVSKKALVIHNLLIE